MQRFVILVVTLGLLALPLLAQGQEYPKAEIFGGYQYSHFEGSINANGWNASATGNVNRYLGFTGDFSGTYKTISGVSGQAYTYTVGPALSLNHEGVINPFAHALVGGFHLNASMAGFGSGSLNGFAMLMGGGADVKVHRNFAIRAAQVDWMFFRSSGSNSSKNVRVSTGVVLRF